MAASSNNQSSIMFTDMVGYSRIISQNESHALKLLDEHNKIIISLIKKYEGRVIKLIGDSVFAHFNTVQNAACCAINIQQDIQKRNKLTHQEDHFHIRIGLHKGQFVVKEDDLFGNDVNLGSRIEGIAPKDGIAVSEIFFREIENSQNMWLREMGHIKLKNIVTPQQIFKLYLDKQRYQQESDTELRKKQEEQGVNFVDIETYQETQVQSLAILYLDNLGKDEDEILCHSISDNMIEDLKKVSSIRSPSFNTVQKFKNSKLPLSEIARRLNVDNIVSGSMLKVGDKLKVSMEMVSTHSGEVCWADAWEGSTKYTGTLNGQMISSILDNMDVEIPEHIKRYFTYEMTENAEANEIYLKGKQSLEYIQNHDKLNEAEGYFINAIKLDTQFVEAYAYLGMVYWWMTQYQKAEDQLESALVLAKESFNEPGLATVYNFLGILYKRWKKYPKAIRNFEKSLELHVQLKDRFGEGKVLQNMGGCYSQMLEAGSSELAKKYMNKAMKIYMDFEEELAIGNALAEMGNIYKNGGQLTESLENHTKALGMFRKTDVKFNEYKVLTVIFDTYTNLGMYESTERYLEDLKSFEKSFKDYYSIGRTYSFSSEINLWRGNLKQAEDDMQEAIYNFEAGEQDFQLVDILNRLAYYYLEKGETEKANRTLRKSERIAEKNEETSQILRIQLIKEFIKASEGNADLDALNKIEIDISSDQMDSVNDQTVSENWWFLSECFRFSDYADKATELLKKAQEIIIEAANNISDATQRQYFLEENIFNRKIMQESPV